MINTAHIICRRYAKRMTQRELAERLGVTTNYIHRVERGKQGASVRIVLALCRELGTEPSKVLSWE